MTKEKKYNENKSSKERKKDEQLKLLSGIDLCACGSGHRLKCSGICRKSHTDPLTQEVNCEEKYRIDERQSNSQRPKRTWKYGHQRKENNNEVAKQQRRKKWEKDRSEGV
jgi:hypothetical protein